MTIKHAFEIGGQGAPRRFAPTLLALVATAINPGQASAAPLEQRMAKMDAASRQGTILVGAIQRELDERGATPEGLGAGNGPGVDISDVFNTVLAAGTPEGAVTTTLKAAGFTLLALQDNDGEDVITATKQLSSSSWVVTQAIAVVRFKIGHGGKGRLGQVRASLTWSTL